MERNVSYEIRVKPQQNESCISLLYGNEEEYDRYESEQNDFALDDGQVRSVFGGLALLFAASLATVIMLML